MVLVVDALNDSTNSMDQVLHRLMKEVHLNNKVVNHGTLKVDVAVVLVVVVDQDVATLKEAVVVPVAEAVVVVLDVEISITDLKKKVHQLIIGNKVLSMFYIPINLDS